MNFLRLHLPGLHQALRGALDSFSTFVSYLLGDEVPTAERREACAAEELGEVTAGRPGSAVEEEAQEALEDLGSRQSKGNGGLARPGEARCHRGGSSATEQTWSQGEGSSHRSQGDRQDAGAWEAAKASRCQEPSAPLEARKKSEAEAGPGRSSQTQESQECNEQEVNREETPRTWEQEEEEEEEVRAREPGEARGAESEWTWHREPEGKARDDRQEVAGNGRESEQAVKEAVAEETQRAGTKETGREEEAAVAMLRDGQSTRAQGTWDPGAESEDRTASGREEETRTASGEEDRTASGREEVRTASGEEEDRTASGREEETRTASGEEEARTASGEEDRTASGEEETRTASGEETRTASGEEEDRTASGREEETRTASGEEDRTASGREEVRTASGEEEDRTASGEEETRTASGEETRTTSGEEEADLPGIRGTECGAIPGDGTPEDTGRVLALEESSSGGQEEDVGEYREAEVSLFPKQTPALATEGAGEAAEDQTAGKGAAEGGRSEWEAGEGFEDQADQDGKETRRRQDSEIRATQASAEEAVQAQEAEEEKQSWPATEARPQPDEAVKELEGDADSEATPEARPEKGSREERREEEAQMGGEELGVQCGGPEHKATESQEPELIGGLQTSPEHLEGGKEELWSVPALSKEETERSPEDSPRSTRSAQPAASEAEVWGNQRRDVERGSTWEESAGTQDGVGEAAGGQESALPEVLEEGGEGESAKGAGDGADSQGPGGGRPGAEVGTGQSGGEADAGETEEEEEEEEEEADRGWRLEDAALNPQDGEGTPASSWATEIVESKAASSEWAAGTGEGPEREAGEAWEGACGRGWDSGREEAGGGEEALVEAAGEDRGGQEFGPEGSAGEKVPGRGDQVDREGEPGAEWAGPGGSVFAEGSWGLGGVTSGSQAVRAEGTTATAAAEGLLGGKTLLEKEAGVWQAGEQGQGSEGPRGDRSPAGEAHAPCHVEGVEGTGPRRAEAEGTEPEDLGDIQGREDPSTSQGPAEAEPGPHEEAAGGPRGDAHGGWSEALLPGSLLDVSAPRSRALLSRSSSQRRSRPSFRRSPAPEQQQEPASPPPGEDLAAPEQRPLQLEEPPEPSPPRPEGTPVPARRRPLGRGFGLAHSGMMNELQARLGRPQPQ
ncbi:apolipoprotein B receptor isoform X2 [Saccopteryx leptura]|uniref:apolipoprotein B receptor isoform X2 n=1 Tax=Saccopteryx leptura TaxID=249018 RepID=UPI00339C37EE